MRKTKIICTLGPATDNDDVLEQLIIEGMDVARFNFSHNSCEEQKERMDKVKALRAKHHRPVACLLDTKGPEIRIKTFKNGSIHLERGQDFCLTTRDVEGTEEIVSVTYEDFIKDISVGSSILIDDGLIELKVVSIEGEDAHCQVVNGGTISNRKGVNLPGVKISMPYLSDKDRADILFGIQEDVDFIAASFTRNAGDIRQIRQLLKENGGEDIRIIAKVENAEGIENIDEIIEASDGVMVARGDMGVEIPEEEVPILQKMIIHKVCAAGKVVITATQMLDSMIKNPRPTRAETTDVANAIFDGTSAIMLSGETAAGAYPVEALKTMSKIAMRAEKAINYQKAVQHPVLTGESGRYRCDLPRNLQHCLRPERKGHHHRYQVWFLRKDDLQIPSGLRYHRLCHRRQGMPPVKSFLGRSSDSSERGMGSIRTLRPCHLRS